MHLTEGSIAARARDLIELTESTRQGMQDDPFGNPVLAVSLAISRMLESGTLDTEDIAALVQQLRDQAFADRASRLADYIGGSDPGNAVGAMTTLAGRLAAVDDASWDRFRGQIEGIRFAAVFTAHPTSALPRAVYQDLAERVGGAPGRSFESHRPSKPTLAEEFEQVCAAVTYGRDAIDRLTLALLQAARSACPVGVSVDADAVCRFAEVLIDRREDALLGAGPLLEELAAVIASADEPARMGLCVERRHASCFCMRCG